MSANFKKIYKLDISDFIRKRTDLINEVVTVCDKIINEVKHFDYNKEYYNIYKGFRESIDETYIYYFPHILDLSARLMIHEIYLAVDSLDDIVINSNLINGNKNVLLSPNVNKKYNLLHRRILTRNLY